MTIVTTINVCKTLYLATCYVYSVNKLCKLVSADKGSCVITTYVHCMFSRQARTLYVLQTSQDCGLEAEGVEMRVSVS